MATTTTDKATHTPGPWKYDLSWGAVVSIGETTMRICEPPGQQNRGPHGELSPAEEAFEQANARLIAAAPELLEACRALVHEVRVNHGPMHVKRDFHLMVDLEAARAAIAKATGKD